MARADDHELAALIAMRAGALLLEVRREAEKPAGSPGPDDTLAVAQSERRSLGDDGDRRAHELIVSLLRQERPDDAVLSEEGVQPGAGGRIDADHGERRIWIVDPLDGTREFSEGRADFAVHVALIDRAVPVAGAVALPGDDLLLTTGDPPRLPPRGQGPLRILVSRTRPPAEVALVAERLEAELVPMGSAGAKTMAVVRGDGDIYLHSGGQYEWDSAAPVAVARAAGVHASRLDGSDLVYDRPDPWLPDLLICRPELVAPVLSASGPTRSVAPVSDRADEAVVIRTGTPSDAGSVARLHAELISEGFLAHLGPRFLSHLYRCIASGPDSFLIVATGGPSAGAGGDGAPAIAGFVAGALDLRALYRRFALRHGVAAALSSLPRLVSALPRVWETLRHGAGTSDPETSGAELLSVAVAPAWRGRHVGALLVDGFLAELDRRGVADAQVVVGADNATAVALYERAGFARARTFELHRGTTSLVMRRSG